MYQTNDATRPYYKLCLFRLLFLFKGKIQRVKQRTMTIFLYKRQTKMSWKQKNNRPTARHSSAQLKLEESIESSVTGGQTEELLDKKTLKIIATGRPHFFVTWKHKLTFSQSIHQRKGCHRYTKNGPIFKFPALKKKKGSFCSVRCTRFVM